MSESIKPLSESVFDAAVNACKASMLAAGLKLYDRVVTVTSGTKLRYMKATWEPGTDEQNTAHFDQARQIFWDTMMVYMYMTVVDNRSFAIAIREAMYELAPQPEPDPTTYERGPGC